MEPLLRKVENVSDKKVTWNGGYTLSVCWCNWKIPCIKPVTALEALSDCEGSIPHSWQIESPKPGFQHWELRAQSVVCSGQAAWAGDTPVPHQDWIHAQTRSVEEALSLHHGRRTLGWDVGCGPGQPGFIFMPQCFKNWKYTCGWSKKPEVGSPGNEAQMGHLGTSFFADLTLVRSALWPPTESVLRAEFGFQWNRVYISFSEIQYLCIMKKSIHQESERTFIHHSSKRYATAFSK